MSKKKVVISPRAKGLSQVQDQAGPQSDETLSHKNRVGEIAQCFRVLVALAEDLGSIPYTPMVAYNHP